jgi:hypothetical protein
MSIILNILIPLLPLVVKMEIVTIDNSGRLVIPEFITHLRQIQTKTPIGQAPYV